MIDAYEKHDFLMISVDSCRWDTFCIAETKNLKAKLEFKCAYAQATFTLPAHVAMFCGFLPHVNEPIRFYNRFVSYLFFIRGGHQRIASFIEFPAGTRDIVEGLNGMGYRTLGIGATEWFRSPILTESFASFVLTGVHVERQVELACRFFQSSAPSFCFINVGETHDPYKFGDLIAPTDRRATVMRRAGSKHFSDVDWRHQIDCMSFVDNAINPLLQLLSQRNRRTIVVVCGDHGECFGEDGLYGHGFFHPKVMEVPLGIGQI